MATETKLLPTLVHLDRRPSRWAPDRNTGDSLPSGIEIREMPTIDLDPAAAAPEAPVEEADALVDPERDSEDDLDITEAASAEGPRPTVVTLGDDEDYLAFDEAMLSLGAADDDRPQRPGSGYKRLALPESSLSETPLTTTTLVRDRAGQPGRQTPDDRIGGPQSSRR